MSRLDWATVIVASITISIALHLFAIGTLGMVAPGRLLGDARRAFDRWVARRLAYRAAQAVGRRIVGLHVSRRRSALR